MKPLDIARVRRMLPGRRIEWFATIDSTMREAAELAAGGCASGTAVAAEEQTAGQGRHGHIWHSEAGSGLYVSLVLHPRLGRESLPVLTLALGLAAAEAIARAAGVRCDIRWPNDLMFDGRKTGGILVQLDGATAIAGIGLNVNHAVFPPELAAEATSLRIETGHPHSREELMAELLPAVDRYCRMLAEAGSRPILELFSRCSTWVRGKRVRVDLAGGPIEGVTAGLDPNGFLLVRRDNGAEHLIMAGGVRAVSS